MPSSTDRVATYRRRSWPDSGSRPDRAPITRREGDRNYRINSMNWGNFGGRAWRPLQNQSCPFKRRPPERWPSGLRRTLGKRVCGKPYRGFESHSLRQLGQSLNFSAGGCWQLSPVLAAISHLSSGPLIGREVSIPLRMAQILSRALDSAGSVRFLKFECFEQLT